MRHSTEVQLRAAEVQLRAIVRELLALRGTARDLVALSHKSFWDKWSPLAGLALALAGVAISLLAFIVALYSARDVQTQANQAIAQVRQAISTEDRTVSNDILNRFADEGMWRARLTLERYYFLLSGARNNQIGVTETYFAGYVYHKLPLERVEKIDEISALGDHKSIEQYFEQLDK